MSERMKIDFPDEFFEKLSKVLERKKSWLDWAPIVISVVALVVVILFDFILPHIKEADFDIEINREMVLEKKHNIELLEIPISVHNYGKTVTLSEYSDIIFTGKRDTIFTIRGLFQRKEDLRVPERSSRELLINVSNTSFTRYQDVEFFSELLGKTKIEIRAKVRKRIVSSKPVDFKEPNVNIIFSDKGNDRRKRSETSKH